MINEAVTASGEMWIAAVGGMIVFAIILVAVMVFKILPHYRKKKALVVKSGDSAAAPRRMNMKTAGTTEKFVDITSEPNEFMRR